MYCRSGLIRLLVEVVTAAYHNMVRFDAIESVGWNALSIGVAVRL